MDQKMLVNLYAGLVPVVVALIWYNPYLLGRLWGSQVGFAKDTFTVTKIAIVSVLTLIAGYNIANSLGSIVIHQHGIYSMLAGNPDVRTPGTELYNTVQGLMDKYGRNYRTFKHGAFHGMNTGLYFVLPLLLIVGVIENRKVSWILVHAAYFTICLALMGGIVCAYMP